jgi:N-acetylglucosaminyldiphosphoundecaprenol N-acetyl-beta-D-mannosaminyltransferase
METLRHTTILGYNVLDEPADRIATRVCDGLREGPCRSFAFLNPHSIVMASSDGTLQKIFLQEAELLCDGVGLSLANRVLNRRSLHRVWGQDFFLAVSQELSARKAGRVLFLGGHAESIDTLLDRYRREFPGIQELSSYLPAFKSDFSPPDITVMAERINAFRPDVLWIGVGSPKQEKLLYELQAKCRIPCAAAIGAVFDFYSGRVPLGPKWIRDFGLLWAYRLVREPKRLWRRTVISAPSFILRVCRELVRADRLTTASPQPGRQPSPKGTSGPVSATPSNQHEAAPQHEMDVVS